ncbi:MAG: branched-chain amino acid aminotransferase [Alphaproteobacteria bacterium]|nr:branched-chain amino acid aminotransferase [Alphaproteobacteria bacterium]|tara:strand:+ start:2586 stop:3431 length:846 start_codon:yes stop_codon:yes gene_type:complete
MTSQTFFEDNWVEGNIPLVGSGSHAIWLGSIAFDGARAFEGVNPDLDRHCQRLIKSTEVLGMEPTFSAEEIQELALDGIKKFGPRSELYIRPMFWADGAINLLTPDPKSTKFALTIFEAPMPDGTGFSCCLSQFRRPGLESSPTDAKAACHYPNSSRALIESQSRGYQNPVMLDGLGHVAEFATSNIWIVKDGIAITPSPNGSFLNGITRQRIIRLMTNEGLYFEERTIKPEELLEADEIFNTGNYGKVQPVIRYEDKTLDVGPVYRRIRELYWDYAHKIK